MEHKKKRTLEMTSFALHILAMLFMLSDHIGATILVTKGDWMTWIGRLAFPIFAFMTVEGFFCTSSRKRYALRLFLFAMLSEIPFNLMMGGTFLYPFHQNVLWSFLLCLGLMQLNEMAKRTGKVWVRVLTAIGSVLLGAVAGILSMVDYNHFGVWMVLAFYFFRGNTWWKRVMQLLALVWINNEVGGLAVEWYIGDRIVFFSKQWTAVFALIPIWMYNGKQGYHSKTFQYFCYAFYPVHILLLGLMVRYL